MKFGECTGNNHYTDGSFTMLYFLLGSKTMQHSKHVILFYFFKTGLL